MNLLKVTQWVGSRVSIGPRQRAPELWFSSLLFGSHLQGWLHPGASRREGSQRVFSLAGQPAPRGTGATFPGPEGKARTSLPRRTWAPGPSVPPFSVFSPSLSHLLFFWILLLNWKNFIKGSKRHRGLLQRFKLLRHTQWNKFSLPPTQSQFPETTLFRVWYHGSRSAPGHPEPLQGPRRVTTGQSQSSREAQWCVTYGRRCTSC